MFAQNNIWHVESSVCKRKTRLMAGKVVVKSGRETNGRL